VDYGRTQKAEPADIPDHAWVLELEDIEKDSSKLLSRSTFAERKSKSTKNAFEKGAVLYGKLRPYLNKVLLADGPGFCSTEIIPLLAGEGIAAGYLFHWLKSPEFLEYTDEVSHGINMPRLGTEAGRKAPLVLAPLNEQRRIAAKLDTTLAAVEACRQRLDGVAAILKRFRRAVLAAATSGELTREWASGSLWKECSITDVCEVVRGASPRPAGDPRFFGGMGTIPWITVGELTKDSDKYLLSTSCFLTEAGMAKSRCIVPGTLLLTNSGVTLGVPKISMIEGCINDGSVALLGLEEPLKSYVYYVLRSKTQDLRSINQGAAQPNLNTSIVKAIRFMLPDCSKEQSEVVRRIEELFTLADQLEARLDAARKVVDRLTPALLSKAFRGELVPQDPSDEPASVLLERIRAARQAEAGAGKTSRRGRPKAAANPAPVDRNAAPVPSEPLPPDLLTQLLRECGALSERALLAVSELEPERFEQQLFRELERGTAREVQANGQVLLEAVG
jgi:type I restriction enzyme S subunit